MRVFRSFGSQPTPDSTLPIVLLSRDAKQTNQVPVYHLRTALLNSSALPELKLLVEKGLFPSQSFSVTTLSPFLMQNFGKGTPASLTEIFDVPND